MNIHSAWLEAPALHEGERETPCRPSGGEHRPRFEPSVSETAIATQHAIDNVVERIQFLLLLPPEEQQRCLRNFSHELTLAVLAIAKARS